MTRNSYNFKADIPIAYLREVVDYDPETGRFTWLRYDGPMAAIFRGLRADTVRTNGYLAIDFPLYGRYMAHRIAWAWVHGAWPPDVVDHINRVKNDNRLANLRPATTKQNAANKAGRREGLKGATFDRGRWRAQITSGRRMYNLGYYATEQMAHDVYCVAARYFHGEFASTYSAAPAAEVAELPPPRTPFVAFMREYLALRRSRHMGRRGKWPKNLPEDLRATLTRELGDRS